MKSIISFICLVMCSITLVFAQDSWPNRPIKILVPSTPGSQTDIGARIIGEQLSKKFNQPFVIENRPGANGKISNDLIKKAPSDGYTLLFTYAAAHVVTPLIYPNSPDPINDFSPISQIGFGGNVLLVPVDLPVKNLKEFVDYVKSRPKNELAYASWGIGSGGHLCMEFIKDHSALAIKHIPYKSTIESNNALISGQVQFAFSGAHSAYLLTQTGKVKAITISGVNRYSMLSDVSTMSEQGFPLTVTTWFGLFAPKATPESIVAQLNSEINKILVDPNMTDRIKTIGVVASHPHTPAQFTRIIQQDYTQYANVVQKIDLKLE